MIPTLNLICPPKEGDIITHETEHGTFTYTVIRVNEDDMLLNSHVSYEGKEKEDLE